MTMAAAGIVLLTAAPPCAADPDPAAVSKAKAFIEVETKRIWRVAHVSVKKYTACACEGPVATPAGFRLPYTFTWAVKEKGKEVVHTTKLAFNFNHKGTFEGLPIDDIFVIGDYTSRVRPGDGADLAVLPLRLYMKKNVAALPKSIRELVEREISAKVTAERALEVWLLFREHVGPPDDKDDK